MLSTERWALGAEDLMLQPLMRWISRSSSVLFTCARGACELQMIGGNLQGDEGCECAEELRCLPQVLARLVLDHPGVRHRCVADAAEAADHISQLTKALATQPFKVQVSLAVLPLCALHLAYIHSGQPRTRSVR